jgi:hypothetical protein
VVAIGKRAICAAETFGGGDGWDRVAARGFPVAPDGKVAGERERPVVGDGAAARGTPVACPVVCGVAVLQPTARTARANMIASKVVFACLPAGRRGQLNRKWARIERLQGKANAKLAHRIQLLLRARGRGHIGIHGWSSLGHAWLWLCIGP